MDNAPLLLNITSSIAHLILNNPPKNEMNSLFFDELTHIRREQFPSLNIKGMIIYGKGRHFSSGADIDELMALYKSSDTDQKPALFLKENLHSFLAIETLPFPVVAVISGCCLGAGLELAMACHYRIATPNAVFSLPESTFGLIPGCGGTIRLPKLIRTGKAIEMILSGKIISSDEAYSIGLIDSISERDKRIETAINLIENVNSAKETDFVARKLRGMNV